MATAFVAEQALAASEPAYPRVAGEYLHYFENMRAVAILLVIAGHCCGLAWSASPVRWSDHDPVVSFIAGSTAIFVFVSGFFFHHVFRGAFDHAAFVARKARSLLPPLSSQTKCNT